MLLFLLFLFPLLTVGVIIFRKVSSINRLELLLPAGSILGLTLFTFFLNFVSFIVKGYYGILFAYFLTVCLGLIFSKFIKSTEEKISFPQGKQLIFWLLSILAWGSLIFWKSANALIGSDTSLYYAIAHSFVKGNFPFLTPWQPDIPLSYHTGASELLGAFYFFTGIDFQFIHLFFSALFIFCAAQIIIWIIKSKTTLMSFLLSNLAAAAAFISFGFFYIVWPVFPIQLPVIGNINQFILWLRDLPTVNQAVEVYGAPINLDSLIYFVFHSFGLAIFFLILVVLIEHRKTKCLKTLALIAISLAVLALVNEGLFIAAFPAILFGLGKKLKRIIFFSVLTLGIVIFQGGIIPASLVKTSNLESSVLIFPKKEDIKEDFSGYHLGQESSKLLPVGRETLPFRWLHVGIGVLLILSLVIVLMFKESILFRILFISGLSSLFAYNVIVPKFLVANGNRFLSASFLFFSLLLCLSLMQIFEKIKKNVIKKALFLIVIGWVFIPTIFPPLALLSKNRFGENKLEPKQQQSSDGVLWLKNNISFEKRVLVLDKNAPHPSGQVRALVEAGVFAPVFSGDYRAFTIEASPEYMDIAYYLSPQALKKLKINILLIDNIFYETLPEKRKQQLIDERYFEKIFNSIGEKIYKIKVDYLENGSELDGTFAQLISNISTSGKIYIDNEENFKPSFLRRPLIFTLKDKDIYYLPQSGVYLNVEADINSHPPRENFDYGYLVLGKDTDPYDLCMCKAELVWTGLRGQVVLWKVKR